MRRLVTAAIATLSVLFATAAPADACAGLIGSRGSVNLGRTTTLAAYHAGVEHYVTAFQFLGGGGEFGTLIPLPGVPSSVERGGDWTLQRLVRETEPQVARLDSLRSLAAPAGAQVLQQVRIDALDITVLKGGGPDVAAWAREHGFSLSPDAPEVLDFYAARSPIFLAAIFDGDAAKKRGQRVGDGTPVHITIPTTNPWVPLRILALGKKATDRVEADVFLLTDRTPALLPGPRDGLGLLYSASASAALLGDLRSDKGMSWVPEKAWLTKLRVDTAAGDLRYDLAVDASGQGTPSRVAAGLDVPGPNGSPAAADPSLPTLLGVGAALLLLAAPMAMSLARVRSR
ncbi:MAG TPA: DUF2330 domain-containing protein [Candidatus Limnocylindria bacterium]|nr:DUF2330 domain-containing protein [Candidatus Limnocylindria bacterium]